MSFFPITFHVLLLLSVPPHCSVRMAAIEPRDSGHIISSSSHVDISKKKIFKNGITPQCLCLRLWDVHCSHLYILQFMFELIKGPKNIKPETFAVKESDFHFNK